MSRLFICWKFISCYCSCQVTAFCIRTEAEFFPHWLFIYKPPLSSYLPPPPPHLSPALLNPPPFYLPSPSPLFSLPPPISSRSLPSLPPPSSQLSSIPPSFYPPPPPALFTTPSFPLSSIPLPSLLTPHPPTRSLHSPPFLPSPSSLPAPAPPTFPFFCYSILLPLLLPSRRPLKHLTVPSIRIPTPPPPSPLSHEMPPPSQLMIHSFL